MRATSKNTKGACHRCGLVKPYVLGSAFQGDGTATFRMLCASCERIEKYRNEPHLFVGVAFVYVEEPEPEPEEESEPEPVDSPQMDLFA